MSRTDPLLLEVTRRILHDVADPQTRRSGGGKRDGRAAAWQALEDHGLTRAWVPEAAGGSGAGIADGFEILTLAGGVALDAPLAETLLAGWLLAGAGLTVPDGMLAPAATYDDGVGVGLDADGRLSGQVADVPFARDVDRLAVFGLIDGGPPRSKDRNHLTRSGSLVGNLDAVSVPLAGTGEAFVALVDRAACTVHPRDNLAGEPRDTVRFDGVTPIALAPAQAELRDRLLAMGAVARACQMAGALQGILGRSVAYVGERVAFDRPIGKFQAIQHALARLAGETAVALAASGSAADALAGVPADVPADVPAHGTDDADGVFLEVASAKIRVGEAAAAGAAIAHQVHGAIGFSTEHPLHLFTQRLWAWRDDFGTESAWAVRLGAHVAKRGADALWPMVAAR